jgi:hypothetical protein
MVTMQPYYLIVLVSLYQYLYLFLLFSEHFKDSRFMGLSRSVPSSYSSF